MICEPAPAKINLTLQVTGRRADGYHLLDSLVVFAGVHDVVSAAPADDLSLTLDGPFAPTLSADPGNLVLRAARALAEAAGVRHGAALHLEKRLPVASGIGGGSADAAAALRVLMRVWDVRLPEAVLHRVAAELGADVPVCLRSVPRRMAGIGDVLTAAPIIPPCGIVLVNPGVALATQAVFHARGNGDKSDGGGDTGFSLAAAWPAGWPDAAAMAADLARGTNDLQAAAIGLCPAIGQVLAVLAAAPGVLLARMSGSGATCFALFASPGLAAQAAASVSRPGPASGPDWWCWGGPLYDAAAAS